MFDGLNDMHVMLPRLMNNVFLLMGFSFPYNNIPHSEFSDEYHYQNMINIRIFMAFGSRRFGMLVGGSQHIFYIVEGG